MRKRHADSEDQRDTRPERRLFLPRLLSRSAGVGGYGRVSSTAPAAQQENQTAGEYQTDNREIMSEPKILITFGMLSASTTDAGHHRIG